MLGLNKQTTTPKHNGVDNLIHKLKALPPVIDLIVAATLSGYSFVAIYVSNAKFVGLVCILIALIFAVLGISAVTREIRESKMVEQYSTPEALRMMNTHQFEKYLVALFSLDGYQVRPSINELHREDDADLIAVKKKETILIQYNHWDEDIVGPKPIKSLHKAAAALRADGAMAICFGRFTTEAVDWARRKGVTLMSMQDVIDMACRLTGLPLEEATPEPYEEVMTERIHEVADVVRGHHRFLFVDFAGIDHGLVRLCELLLHHPVYQLIASTIPPLKTIEDVRLSLGECGDRLIGHLEATQDGRYFAIQKYLQSSREGKCATWLAVDSEPRQFPEGCVELIAVNRAFGFDASASQRLVDAMVNVDRRARQASSFGAGGCQVNEA
ncbi:restriction endonuclease [Sulfuricystis multivorans]|uniref:restriction endonuclease n=1 Tax=Sulfuricystis multivorans TaxID=2211108 RepID=UPI0015587786|nr:restriction endonuclease [Sulfuricystis multivorans]